MQDDDRPRPGNHTFIKTSRLLDDFFKVDEYCGTYERYDNTFSEEQRLLVFERGDSVAALLYDPTNNEVLLIEQFRLPTVKTGRGHGWIVETAAGMIREAEEETPRAAMIRELREEIGYQVTDLSEIATFFVSPGGTSERIFLYFAEVRRAQQSDKGGGNLNENEDIRPLRMPVMQFFAKLRNREFEDAKLIIAGQWLRERLATRPVDDLADPVSVERVVKGGTGKKIVGYKAGHIKTIMGLEAWVNPVSTDMMLDRFTDRTVSAAIRRLGAEKSSGGKGIKRDTIGEALRKAMDNRSFVAPAKVLSTPSGALQATHGVSKIFHVATARGEITEATEEIRFNLSIDKATLETCVDNVLQAVEVARLKSVLIPMLGTGLDGLPVNQVAQPLMARAIDYFERHPKSRIERVYFLGYSITDADTLGAAMKSLGNRLVDTD